MVKLRIPINNREIVDGELKETKGEIVAGIDVTVYAEERWQKHFPENAKRETLFAYVERIQSTNKTEAKDNATIISNLKALYCFLESDDLPDFKAFLQMFDLSDQQTLEKQVKTIKTAFDLVLQSSAVTGKNF